MADLIPCPFPLPERFLDALGYGRAVAAFESPAMRARLIDLLRQQDLDGPLSPPTGPRRYVALWRESAGDELAFADGAHSACQLHRWAWLDYVGGRHGPDQLAGRMYAWLREHQIDLGFREAPATHALLIDADSVTAWVAPLALAHRVVRAQSLALEAQP